MEIKDFLTKFENGEERYNQSSLFNAIVKSLLQGNDPVRIIDQLLKIIDGLEVENMQLWARLRKKSAEIIILTDANNPILTQLPRTEEGTEKSNPSEH